MMRCVLDVCGWRRYRSWRAEQVRRSRARGPMCRVLCRLLVSPARSKDLERSSCFATNSQSCTDRTTDQPLPTRTGLCWVRSRRPCPDRSEPAGRCPLSLSERPAVRASSTNTNMPPDQPRHDFGHPQAVRPARARELPEHAAAWRQRPTRGAHMSLGARACGGCGPRAPTAR